MIRSIILAVLLSTTSNSSYYSVQRKMKVHALQEGHHTLGVALHLKKGWKWNYNYPFSVRLTIDGKKRSEIFSYRLESNWNEDSRTPQTVVKMETAVPSRSVKQQGVSSNIFIIASFSLCNKTSCKVWQREKFTIQLLRVEDF